MNKNYYILFFLLFINFISNAQIKLINKKGTIMAVDTGMWEINANNIYNKNTGNVGVGKLSPTFKLDISGRVNADSTIAAPNYTSKVQSTATGSSYTWNLDLGANTAWTLSAGTNSLTISNAKAGMYGLIRIINSGTSTLTFASGTHKVINGGAGVILLTQTASAVDILTFYYDGATYWWTYGNNYN